MLPEKSDNLDDFYVLEDSALTEIKEIRKYRSKKQNREGNKQPSYDLWNGFLRTGIVYVIWKRSCDRSVSAARKGVVVFIDNCSSHFLREIDCAIAISDGKTEWESYFDCIVAQENRSVVVLLRLQPIYFDYYITLS